MSIFTSIGAGISKSISFLVNVFTKTKEVEDMFVALAPATKAAILATFYDVSKTVAAASAAAGAAEVGNVPLAITLSETTLSLIKAVVADAKKDASVIANDLKALGVII
jgi:PPE-repeat protein